MQLLDVGIQSLVMVAYTDTRSSVVYALFPTTDMGNSTGVQRVAMLCNCTCQSDQACAMQVTGIEYSNLHRVTPIEKAQMLSVVDAIPAKHSLALQ